MHSRLSGVSETTVVCYTSQHGIPTRNLSIPKAFLPSMGSAISPAPGKEQGPMVERNPPGSKSEDTEETLGRRNMANLSASVSRFITALVGLDLGHFPRC